MASSFKKRLASEDIVRLEIKGTLSIIHEIQRAVKTSNSKSDTEHKMFEIQAVGNRIYAFFHDLLSVFFCVHLCPKPDPVKPEPKIQRKVAKRQRRKVFFLGVLVSLASLRKVFAPVYKEFTGKVTHRPRLCSADVARRAVHRINSAREATAGYITGMQTNFRASHWAASHRAGNPRRKG